VIHSSIVSLYDYQKGVLRNLRASLEESGSVVLQMPTGSGKTVTAAEFIRQESAKGPVWFVCHRREIIRQVSRAFTSIGIRHDVIAPNPGKMDLGFGYDPTARVKIASVQTLSRRLDQYEAPRLVVWDECHHVAAGTWARMREQLSGARHVGLTATPERLDGKGLADWFSGLICGPSIKELVSTGRLSKIRMFAPSQPDLTSARVSMGDYRKDDADALMNTPVLIGSAVEEYKRHANGTRAIVFATSVEASRNIAERFNEEGIRALHVDATTPLDERDAAIAGLSSGELKVLTNVEVFTEGVDVPRVETVILFRPTRSLTLYLQMVGRGMRVAEGKDTLTVLDHAGLVYEHGFPDAEWEWSLDGKAKQKRIGAPREAGERIRKCPSCSHVHEPASECPNCGHEYVAREIAECEGELRELGNGPPLGCETQTAFSVRIGLSQASVSKYVSSGMPNVNGFPIVTMAMEWVNQRKTPEGCETVYEWARRTGVSTSAAYRNMQRGSLPSRDGYVISAEADEWAKSGGLGVYYSAIRPPSDVVNPTDYEPASSFAKRMGVRHGTVYAWLRRGLPSSENRWVHIEAGTNWVRENASTQVEPVWAEGEWVTRAEALKRIGYKGAPPAFIDMNKVASLENGRILWSDFRREFEENFKAKKTIDYEKVWEARKRNQQSRVPEGHETKSDFAKRLGKKGNTISQMVKDGLPTSTDGFVPISRALQWVEARPRTKIPPSAWDGVEPD
jgi:superfamily II DNA or RNA helicase